MKRLTDKQKAMRQQASHPADPRPTPEQRAEAEYANFASFQRRGLFDVIKVVALIECHFCGVRFSWLYSGPEARVSLRDDAFRIGWRITLAECGEVPVCGGCVRQATDYQPGQSSTEPTGSDAPEGVANRLWYQQREF